MCLPFVNDPISRSFRYLKSHKNFPSAHPFTTSRSWSYGLQCWSQKKLQGEVIGLSWSGEVAHNISHWSFQYLQSSTHWIKFMRWTEISHCQHRLHWVMYDSHFAEIPCGDVLAGPGEIQLNWVLAWSVESGNPLLFDDFDAGSICLHHLILSLKIMKYNFADSLTLPSN